MGKVGRWDKFPNVCDHCMLKQIKEGAIEQGLEVTLEHVPGVGVHVYVHPIDSNSPMDDAYRTATFTAIPDHCVC